MRRAMSSSPDVSVSRTRRGTPVKDVTHDAKVWADSHLHHIAKNKAEIGIFSSFAKKA